MKVRSAFSDLKINRLPPQGFEHDLIKVLYERCGSWPQKLYDDRYSTGRLRHYIATRRYAFFHFRNAEAGDDRQKTKGHKGQM